MVSDNRSVFKRIVYGASLACLSLLFYILLQGQIRADTYTVTSSSNQKLNSESQFRPDDVVPLNDPSLRTWVPIPNKCKVGDPDPYETCMVMGTMFGNGLPPTGPGQNSNEDLSQCFGGNSYNFDSGNPTFNHTCGPNGVDMDGAFPGGNPVQPIVPSVSTLIKENGDPNFTFNESVINKFLSNAPKGDDSNCANLASYNNPNKHRCNNIGQSFSQYQKNNGGASFLRDFNISFSINSLVDDEGNLIGDVEGEFRQELEDTDGATNDKDDCKGTFKFDAGTDSDSNGKLDGFEDSGKIAGSTAGDWIPDGFTFTGNPSGPCKWGGPSQIYGGSSQN